jgi:hypothetical protein
MYLCSMYLYFPITLLPYLFVIKYCFRNSVDQNCWHLYCKQYDEVFSHLMGSILLFN